MEDEGIRSRRCRHKKQHNRTRTGDYLTYYFNSDEKKESNKVTDQDINQSEAKDRNEAKTERSNDCVKYWGMDIFY